MLLDWATAGHDLRSGLKPIRGEYAASEGWAVYRTFLPLCQLFLHPGKTSNLTLFMRK